MAMKIPKGHTTQQSTKDSNDNGSNNKNKEDEGEIESDGNDYGNDREIWPGQRCGCNDSVGKAMARG
jgi:hypothetical protein